MPRPLRRILAPLVLLCAFAAAASAGPRSVVVLGAAGPHAAEAETALQRALASRYGVIAADRYARTAKRLRARGQAGMARVAGALSATALVEGVVKKKRTKWFLVVTVYDGADGSVLGTIDEPLRGPAIGGRVQGRLATDLPPIIDSARGPRAAAVAAGGGFHPGGAAPTEEHAPIAGATESGEASENQGASESHGGGEEGGEHEATASESGEESSEEGGGESGAGVAATPTLVAQGTRLQPALDLDAGLSFVGREFHFTSSTAQQGYSGTPVPGVRVDVAAFPFAFGHSSPALAGLGIGLVFDRALLISSQLQSQPGLKLDTTEQELDVGLRYRYHLGGDPARPTLRFEAGYGIKQFGIAHIASAVLLPDVDYHYVDLGAGIGIPLGTPAWSVVIDGAYLPVLSTGAIGDPSAFGGGSQSGVDADVGIEWRPRPDLVVRAAFRYMAMFLSFDGSGAEAHSGSMQTVNGATDQYYGGFVTVGWLY